MLREGVQGVRQGMRRAGVGIRERVGNVCRIVCVQEAVSLSCVSSMSGRVSPYQVPYLSTVGC